MMVIIIFIKVQHTHLHVTAFIDIHVHITHFEHKQGTFAGTPLVCVSDVTDVITKLPPKIQ